MPLYIFLYISVAIALFYSGYIYNKVYKNLSSFYLFFSLATFSLWLSAFLLAFSSTYDPDILLYLSRLMFSSSILGLYLFLCFLYFLNKKLKTNEKKRILIITYTCATIFMLFGVVSPYIISEMIYSQERAIYYELYGIFYNVFVILYLLFFPLFIHLSYYRILELRKIEKNRIKYMCFGFGIFVISGIILQVILPLLGIYVFEREVVLLLIPFLLCFWYIHNRYYFTDISVSLGKIAIFLFSLLFAFFIVFFVNEHIQRLPEVYKNFWNISSTPYIYEFFIGVIIHSITYKFLLYYMLPHAQSGAMVEGLFVLKEGIPRITNEKDLNRYLSEFFENHLHIPYIKIRNKPKIFHEELNYYFTSGISREVFINDKFFIEKNKNKFLHYEKLEDISKKIHLVLPGYSKQGGLNLLLELGVKTLGTPYGREEIIALKSFVKFLQGHLKYISTYKEIQELSINLDKKVDEKTIEFNNLLNKQKEFIAYVGHEIKNPITNTLFLSDSIKQDISGKIDKDVEEDISILYDELVKVSKLVKYIFSAEKFDLDKVELYKESINISNFLKGEVHNFTHNYPYITFSGYIQEDIVLDIDETQFRQVIQNLVNNSVKFMDRKKPEISINLSSKNDTVYITIEDNGKGFKDKENENIFSKYVTGSGSATGLGMGLYLCKKIVELHEGKIKAGSSKNLKGACFTIKL